MKNELRILQHKFGEFLEPTVNQGLGRHATVGVG